MLNTLEFWKVILLLCAIAVAISAVTGVFLLARLSSTIRQALRPTVEEKASRLNAQAKANQNLLETSVGRQGLVEFFVSEANISAFFRETEEKILEASSDEELNQLLERLKGEEEKKPWYSLDRLKKGAKAIGEKLFDKANDLIKPWIGGE